jgi:hypothetical protein
MTLINIDRGVKPIKGIPIVIGSFSNFYGKFKGLGTIDFYNT